MARNQTGGRKLSWELIGMTAILAVLLIAGLLAMVSSPDKIGAPQFNSVQPEGGTALATGSDPDGRPMLGDPDAAVTVYEFADFQCPHCKAFTETESPKLKESHLATGKAKVVWVNAPFKGAESRAAATAALCAHEQGQFWPMHDWLFANQPVIPNDQGFSQERLTQMATEIGLDPAAFTACLADPAIADRVAADEAFLAQKGVNSTPSFLVGEKMVVGADAAAVGLEIDAAAGSAP